MTKRDARRAYRRYVRAVHILTKGDPFANQVDEPLTITYDPSDHWAYLAYVGKEAYDLVSTGRSEKEALAQLVQIMDGRLTKATARRAC